MASFRESTLFQCRTTARAALAAVLSMALLVIVALSACSAGKVGGHDPAPLESATHFIDQGNYDDAIQILESGDAPQDDSKVITTLASAYAARAGIKVQDFWGFVIGYDRLLTSEGLKSQKSSSSNLHFSVDLDALPRGIPRSTVEFLQNLNVNLTQLDMLISRVQQIPYVPSERRADLLHAISILNRTTEPGSRLYRSVLTIIVVRSEFQDLNPSLEAWAQANYSFCAENLTTFADLLINVRDQLASMADDMTYAYPSKADQFRQFQTQLRDSDSFFASLTHAKDRLPCSGGRR